MRLDMGVKFFHDIVSNVTSQNRENCSHRLLSTTKVSEEMVCDCV